MVCTLTATVPAFLWRAGLATQHRGAHGLSGIPQAGAALCASLGGTWASHFLQSSKAQISVSQLDDPLTKEIFYRFVDLLPCLAREEALSLAEARALYHSCLLDTLCSVLRRLQWRQFCNQLDVIAGDESLFILLGCNLDCLQKQISAWNRVLPISDAALARLETFGRYTCLASVHEQCSCLSCVCLA